MVGSASCSKQPPSDSARSRMACLACSLMPHSLVSRSASQPAWHSKASSDPEGVRLLTCVHRLTTHRVRRDSQLPGPTGEPQACMLPRAERKQKREPNGSTWSWGLASGYWDSVCHPWPDSQASCLSFLTLHFTDRPLGAGVR